MTTPADSCAISPTAFLLYLNLVKCHKIPVKIKIYVLEFGFRQKLLSFQLQIQDFPLVGGGGGEGGGRRAPTPWLGRMSDAGAFR